jgi:hypothetical protein
VHAKAVANGPAWGPGSCSPAASLRGRLADGKCDAFSPDLACTAFGWDGGDCAPPARAPHAVLRENSFVGGGVALEVLGR